MGVNHGGGRFSRASLRICNVELSEAHMNRFRLVVLFVFFLTLPSLVRAQQAQTISSVPVRDLQAVAILRQSYVVMGGDAIRRISDATFKGQITQQRAVDEVQGTITYQLKDADKCRVDMEFDGDVNTNIVNGNRGFKTMGGAIQETLQHFVANHPFKFIPVLFEFAHIDDPFLKVTYVGPEALGDQTVHHIHIETVYPGMAPESAAAIALQTSTELYIDTKTLLLTKRTQNISSLQSIRNTIQMSQYFKDYRVEGNILVPHTVSVYLRDQKFQEITFTNVAMNTGILSSQFETHQ
jgi:hypothetical protein